jgi:hypothetical protein
MTKYTGVVEGIRDGVAYVTLRDPEGEEFECEFPANPDLRERRRFTVVFETVPDVELSPEREAQITAEIDAALGDKPGDDY